MKKVVDAGSSGEFGWHACETALRCPRLYAYKFRDKKPELEPVAQAPKDSLLDLPGLSMQAPDVGRTLFTMPAGVKLDAAKPAGRDNKAPLYRGSLIHAGLANYYRAMQAYQQGENVDEWAEPEEAIDCTWKKRMSHTLNQAET